MLIIRRVCRGAGPQACSPITELRSLFPPSSCSSAPVFARDPSAAFLAIGVELCLVACTSSSDNAAPSNVGCDVPSLTDFAVYLCLGARIAQSRRNIPLCLVPSEWQTSRTVHSLVGELVGAQWLLVTFLNRLKDKMRLTTVIGGLF